MIKLDENFSLTNDNSQWVLNYEKEGEMNPKTNKVTISTDTWYCGRLENALSRYASEATKPANSVLELQELVNTVKNNINNLKIK